MIGVEYAGKNDGKKNFIVHASYGPNPSDQISIQSNGEKCCDTMARVRQQLQPILNKKYH
jgi:hypothetical protein